MAASLLHLSLLLSAAYGFVEHGLLQLQDCCSSGYQGLVLLIDRENVEYNALKEKNFDTLRSLSFQFDDFVRIANYNGPALVSEGVLKGYLNWYTRQGHTRDIFENKFVIKRVEDFYLLLPIGWEKAPFARYLAVHNLGPSIAWSSISADLSFARNKKFDAILCQIFCNAKNSSAGNDLQWMVYSSGHGSTDKDITGLPLDEFRDFSEFLRKKLSTKVLIYLSCFSGGINREKGFTLYDLIPAASSFYKKNSAKNPEPNSSKVIFPYTIVALSSGESVAFSLDSIKFSQLFDQLANYFSASKKDLSELYAIIKNTGFISSDNGMVINTIPQIRVPYADYFSPVPEGAFNTKEIVTLSGVQAQNRSKDYVITPECKVIFIATTDPAKIYTEKEPHTLNFKVDFSPLKTTSIMPRAIFSNVNNQYYRFKYIDAGSLSFEHICNIFLPTGKNQAYTLFIDTLVCQLGTLKNVRLTITEEESAPEQYQFKMTYAGQKGSYNVLTCSFDQLSSWKPIFKSVQRTSAVSSPL